MKHIWYTSTLTQFENVCNTCTIPANLITGVCKTIQRWAESDAAHVTPAVSHKIISIVGTEPLLQQLQTLWVSRGILLVTGHSNADRSYSAGLISFRLSHVPSILQVIG